MNQIIKTFEVSIIKILEKYQQRNPYFGKLQVLSDDQHKKFSRIFIPDSPDYFIKTAVFKNIYFSRAHAVADS